MPAFSSIAIGALTLLKAQQQVSAAKSKSDAVIAEASLAATNKRKQVQRKAASQVSSFLTSGLTLDGTPQGVIQETFATGLEDVNQIIQNAKTQSKQIISAGRAEALGSLASGFGSAFASGGLSGDGQRAGGLDLTGDLKGINVPFTGRSASFSAGGTIIPPSKPTRINF